MLRFLSVCIVYLTYSVKNGIDYFHRILTKNDCLKNIRYLFLFVYIYVNLNYMKCILLEKKYINFVERSFVTV